VAIACSGAQNRRIALTWLAVRSVTGCRPSSRVWFQFIFVSARVSHPVSRARCGWGGRADADGLRDVHAGVGGAELDAALGVEHDLLVAEGEQGAAQRRNCAGAEPRP
jgi:hypothetical protein